MKLQRLLTLFLLFPAYIFASIAGVYEVSGVSPTHEHYKGTVVIEKQSKGIYTATWTFEDQSIDLGTGVLKGRALSFVFHETSSNTDGVQLYEIGRNALRGPWIRFGANKKGFEKLRKIPNSSSK